jgi:hypothetical protein
LAADSSRHLVDHYAFGINHLALLK